MIFETCPKCGSVLEKAVLAVLPPIHKVYCPKCHFTHQTQDKIEYKEYKPTEVDSDLNITIPADNTTINATNNFEPTSVTINYPSSKETVENKSANAKFTLTGQDIIKYIIENQAYNLPVYRMGEPFHGEEYPVENIHVTKSEYNDMTILMIK